MTVFWSDKALANVEDIASYLQRFSEAAAVRTLLRIADRIDKLDGHPGQGRRVPEYDEDRVREVFVGGYWIWYWVIGDDLELIGIIHAARDRRS